MKHCRLNKYTLKGTDYSTSRVISLNKMVEKELNLDGDWDLTG